MKTCYIFGLLAATAAFTACRGDQNAKPTYGETGLPKNCRAIIQTNIDAYVQGSVPQTRSWILLGATVVPMAILGDSVGSYTACSLQRAPNNSSSRNHIVASTTCLRYARCGRHPTAGRLNSGGGPHDRIPDFAALKLASPSRTIQHSRWSCGLQLQPGGMRRLDRRVDRSWHIRPR